MPLEPFRFLHAANLFLDHQLRGAGRIPESIRETVQQATITAWNRIVDAAIAQQVDFLLLAGNCFDASDHSLTGQVALIAGLEKLNEYDIPVFIAPGSADPDMSWRLGLNLPDNVTRFGGELSEPVLLSRDGRRFCTIHHVMANIQDLNASDGNGLDELAVFAPQFGPNDAGPYDIALLESITNNTALPPELTDPEGNGSTETSYGKRASAGRPAFDQELVKRCPIEYWALGDGLRRQAWRVGQGLAHTPGTPQGLSPDDTGILGCTLVEVDSEGRSHDSIIPTSRVRWENVDLNVQTHTTRDAALQQLRTALESITRTTNDELWLVSLNITGFGRLFQDLQDAEFCHRLWNDAVQFATSSNVDIVLRRVRRTDPSEGVPGADFLSQEFTRQVQAISSAQHNLGPWLLAESAVADGPWLGRIQALLPEMKFNEITQDAQRVGLSWLK